jgi:hypothetical protein
MAIRSSSSHPFVSGFYTPRPVFRPMRGDKKRLKQGRREKSSIPLYFSRHFDIAFPLHRLVF